MSFNNDVTIRRKAAAAAREIKASLHYAYIVNGITLDGSKFTAGELILEGTCLIKDDTTGKYEKYADTTPVQGVIVGLGDVTQADASGIDAGTYLTVTVNGVPFTMGNAALASIGAATTDQELIDLVGAANNGGAVLSDFADITIETDKLTLKTKEAGAGKTIDMAGVWGVAGDEATIEGILGVALPFTGVVGTGTWPTGKSNPVIIDESIKFEIDDEGNNPDVTAGQVLVHGAVYKSMLIGSTTEFEAQIKGFIRLV